MTTTPFFKKYPRDVFAVKERFGGFTKDGRRLGICLLRKMGKMGKGFWI